LRLNRFRNPDKKLASFFVARMKNPGSADATPGFWIAPY
jgi:hypothetical protein